MSGSVQNFHYQNDKLREPFGLGVDAKGMRMLQDTFPTMCIRCRLTDRITDAWNSDIFLVCCFRDRIVRLYGMR